MIPTSLSLCVCACLGREGGWRECGGKVDSFIMKATEHAELVAIGKILQSGFPFAQLSAVDVYVTVEPCIMCAAALILVGTGTGVVHVACHFMFPK